MDWTEPLVTRVSNTHIRADVLAKIQHSHLAPSTFFNGHIVPDFGTILRRGLGGVQADIQRYRHRPLPDVARNFYDAMQITVQGLSTYISRYADLAGRLLNQGTAGYHPEQLEHIQATCRKLAWQPASTFPEALQMVWFLMCFVGSHLTAVNSRCGSSRPAW